ncbi:MAG: PEP-CTERM sorting domain-containing protein [Acidobacteria bacterium]|nr:MAG: PEP-CTERM sorting domain-containing protein [Acidobacteriota bacterium]
MTCLERLPTGGTVGGFQEVSCGTVPEPASFSLLAVGLFGAIAARRWSSKRRSSRDVR